MSAQAKRIEQWEIDRYWEIFSSLSNGGSSLNGVQAAGILKNSKLRDEQLERIWDLSDVDADGCLDFEEFCVAMRLIYDLMNAVYEDVPNILPDWLIPESKAHLIHAGRAMRNGGERFESPDDESADLAGGLSDSFDWYMSPESRSRYNNIYVASRDRRNGLVHFDSLQDLYDSLDVPDTDIRSAWNLVNPRSLEGIGKDACLAFLHILNNRHEGVRIPRSIPPSLRATFQQGKIEYDLNQTQGVNDAMTPSDKKSRFGDAYLSRLGAGERTIKGTDFSTAPRDHEWEEVRLKKQLRSLQNRSARMTNTGSGRAMDGFSVSNNNRAALQRKELEQLMIYKKNQLRNLESFNSASLGTTGLQQVQNDVDMVRGQIDSLRAHLKERESKLEQLRLT